MTDRPPPAPPSESPLQERLRILRESTGSATLTPNAETYVKRAAELVHNEEGPVGQRHTIAGCALRCALQECEAAMRTGGGASAKDSIRLLRFAEELRQAIRECDEAASYAGVVDTPLVDMDEADDRPVRGPWLGAEMNLNMMPGRWRLHETTVTPSTWPSESLGVARGGFRDGVVPRRLRRVLGLQRVLRRVGVPGLRPRVGELVHRFRVDRVREPPSIQERAPAHGLRGNAAAGRPLPRARRGAL